MTVVKSERKVSRVGVSLLLSMGTAAVFLVAAVAVVVLVNHYVRQQALAEAESKAQILLDRNLATHTYFSHDLKPNLFEWTEPFRDKDHFDPTWMSSTYAVRQIDGYFRTLSGANYYYKEAAINARSPENEAQAYEVAFIDELNADPGLVHRSFVDVLDDSPYLVTLRRGEEMEESCLRCHGVPDQAPGELVSRYGPNRSFGREVGDAVSAISIRVPVAEAYAGANEFSVRLSVLLVVLLFCLFGIQFWLNRYLLLVPLSRIRTRALQVAAGGEYLGQAIPVPSFFELGELTTAFNTMSVSLRRSRDELEQRVQERTADLQRLNAQLERELTERKRVEEALSQSQERYRTVSELTSDLAYAFQIDEDGSFSVEWMTESFTRLTGFGPPEVNQRGWTSLIHPDDRPVVFEHLRAVASGQTGVCDLRVMTDNDEDRWLHVYTQPIWDERQERVVRVIGAAQDITERRQTEDTLRRRAEEKEVLLQEIHHRVKNNLQVIASLLRLQAGRVDDEQTRAVFEESCARVRSMSFAHETLYRSDNLSEVDLGGYVHSLTSYLLRMHSKAELVVVENDIDDMALSIDAAVPCGLIINELVSNALKHAFPDEQSGKVFVRLRADQDSITFERSLTTTELELTFGQTAGKLQGT
jgi:PAS domain S-box-containing protein